MKEKEGRAPQEPARSPAKIRADHEPLQVLASDTLALQGDVQRLVTFLNRSLKDDGYIFGLRLAEDGRYFLTIYKA